VALASNASSARFELNEFDKLAGVLLLASVCGKLLGTHLAGKALGWEPGEASLIGWLL
jgi:hypothetical protein